MEDYVKYQDALSDVDPQIYSTIKEEECRQRVKLEMIASENFTSRAVIEATGSILTNKYAEGYIGKRYYGGCEIVDKVEMLAIERAQKIFHAEYVNVQPHSGSSANMAVYIGFLHPGDTILGMDLSHGGHLTHGAAVSFSGKNYNSVSYGVRKDTHLLDFDQIESLAKQHNPKIIIAGASAYSRIIDFEKFADIAQRYNAMLLVDMAHIAGLVVAGIHPSPVEYADVVTSTTHKTLRGPRGGIILVGKDKENIFEIRTKKGKLKTYSQILNSSTMPGLQGGPLMHVIAAKAVAFKECMEDSFKHYQEQTVKNAKILAEEFTSQGISVVSGGTDNHLVLIDVSNCGITGKKAEKYLDYANISANKNAIPYDTQSPFITSGVRFGTPAITSRGMKEDDMKRIALFIIRVLRSKGDEDTLKKVAREVAQLSSGFLMRNKNI